MRTAQHLLDLYHHLPLVKNYLFNKYQTTDLENRVYLFLLGLLHDVGYSDLDSCNQGRPDLLHPEMKCTGNNGIPPEYKFLHSIAGAEIVEDKLADSLLFIMSPNIYMDFVQSIREHNFDDRKCLTTPLDPSCRFRATVHEHSFYIHPNHTYYREYPPHPLRTDHYYSR